MTQGTHRSEFTYDGLSRRVRIVEKENGVTTRDARFIWDGLDIVEERLSGGQVNRFFAAGEQHDGVARYLTRDRLNSVREVTDAAGVAVTRNDYDPYGRLTRVTGTGDSRFGFTGHYNHVPSGLVLAAYRGYDPGIGRWLGEDPIGHVDGPNLYAYVRNAPTRFLDPHGLQVLFGAMPPWLSPLTAASRQLPLPRTTTNPSGTSSNPTPRVTPDRIVRPVHQPMPSGSDLLGRPGRLAQFMQRLADYLDEIVDSFPVTTTPDRPGSPRGDRNGGPNSNPNTSCPAPPPPPECTPDGLLCKT